MKATYRSLSSLPMSLFVLFVFSSTNVCFVLMSWKQRNEMFSGGSNAGRIIAMDIAALNHNLITQVTTASKNPSFKHHAWFVEYHLSIVAQIAQELCLRYPLADAAKVETLVWLHDYEKIIDQAHEYNTELLATKKLMHEVGFNQSYITEFHNAINRYNAKKDLETAPIEIQIVSSADAASHFVGPFFTLYWYENPDKTITELQASNQAKIAKDWEKKITLPEIRQFVEQRRTLALEVAGHLPKTYL